MRRRRAGKTALFLLLAGACSVLLPGAVRALGGPWPIIVSVEGEVRRPGAYTLPHNATLSSLLLAAGGFTDDAEPRGAGLVRASAQAAQETELKATADRLASETGGSEAAADALRPVVALLLELRPSGRVPVRVTLPRLMKNSPDDLRLEDGDALRVPAKAGSVAVAGAVLAASDNVPFTPGLALEEYIRRAGGYAGDADRDAVYLLRADGTTAL
ncbi:MAG: SLBB domain-containing protein, partial [Deltaproteobacteria bacterium]|nr:SLBB domain-containing protein [Deltaproteobacteria bacterium]